MKHNIYLIGFMGVGKSTVSHALAQITGFEELDSDSFIIREKNMPIPEIFEKYGEQYFRDLETRFLREMQEREHCIVSCGGGMPLREENVRLMRQTGVVAELTAGPDTVLARVQYGKERPILNGHMNTAYIETLMGERKRFYDKAGQMKISTDDRAPGEIAEEIKKILESDKFSFDFLNKV